MLNHFNFKREENGDFLVTNDFGLHLFLTNSEFKKLAENRIIKDTELYNKLHQKLFILDPMELYSSEIISDLRKMKNYVFMPTSLHIFVVTNICNLQCIYCQAQSTKSKNHGMMSVEIATKAIDIALQSPSHELTFEFQGGEPLANFSTIKAMVEYTEKVKGDKLVEYTIVSNLTLLTDEIIDFLIQYKFSISTSLDGPREVQNYNRKSDCIKCSYDYVQQGMKRFQERGYYIGAIETTTRKSLSYPKEIVDEYVKLKTNGIFLRPLTPLGFAKEEWANIGYTPEEFLKFYRAAFERILEINKQGVFFPEQHSVYFLKKILHGYSFNYMELRSPCGAGIGQLAYYYDGQIYTCDEARMVAEAGDNAFCLGNVFSDDYKSIVSSSRCYATCAASIIETIPQCTDCVYSPYCGVCPVINYALDKDIFSKQAHGYRCKIFSGILDYLFTLIKENDRETIEILNSWIKDDCDENCCTTE